MIRCGKTIVSQEKLSSNGGGSNIYVSLLEGNYIWSIKIIKYGDVHHDIMTVYQNHRPILGESWFGRLIDYVSAGGVQFPMPALNPWDRMPT